MKVTVDRTKWGRGREGGMLLDPDNGLMCCLGFACLAAGIPEHIIKGYAMPSSCVSNDLSDCPEPIKPLVAIDQGTDMDKNGKLYPFSTDIANKLARANDSKFVVELDREDAIIQFGATIGLEFEFVN